MILVAGGTADKVTELVCARLDACGYDYRHFDLGHYPAGYGLGIAWRDGTMNGCLTGPDWRLPISEISGAYVRFLGLEGRVPPPGLPEAHVREMQLEADSALMFVLDDLPCPVINRLGGGMSNNSKPYQLMQIAAAGLLVPPTMVTSDPETARGFIAEHGSVIYKSISGIRSVVHTVGPEHLARLDLLRHGPAQFQAFIPGHNVRVHTVGERLFATRIRTEAIDYRYAGRDGAAVEMEPAELPEAVADACLRIAARLGLSHAGIDLKETPEGQWYCFEVNPCPGFIYYERHTGQPISLAIAEFLHAGQTVSPDPRELSPSPAGRHQTAAPLSA